MGEINGVALTSSSSQGQSQQSQQGQQQQPAAIRFPNIFDEGFGPTALLCSTPSVKQNCTYGEAIGLAGLSSSANHATVFSIQRPTFESPLDELITNVFGPGSGDAMQGVQATGLAMSKDLSRHHQPIVMDADLDETNPASSHSAQGRHSTGPSPNPTPSPTSSSSSSGAPHRLPRRYLTTNAPPHTSSSTSSDTTPTSGSGKKGRHGPSATGTVPRTIRSSYGKSAPGGVKSECANCGANSTPLWRRRLNGELLRFGGRTKKEGLCNALKLHGEKRSSSTGSDVIQKRSRTDPRRGTSGSATPSASPDASRRTFPTPPTVTQPADNGNFSQAHNGQQQPADHQSPYGQASAASYDTFGNANNGSWGRDNSPVYLTGMSHSMVSDAGVNPSALVLGGTTFSPGLTYMETPHDPGPLSLVVAFNPNKLVRINLIQIF
ncbi:hypothetical protein FRC01_002105 [Tulasnella sp. 417]|nr:hypothetical protein FRC01_002105 [Tulasnella sp. 417]